MLSFDFRKRYDEMESPPAESTVRWNLVRPFLPRACQGSPEVSAGTNVFDLSNDTPGPHKGRSVVASYKLTRLLSPPLPSPRNLPSLQLHTTLVSRTMARISWNIGFLVLFVAVVCARLPYGRQPIRRPANPLEKRSSKPSTTIPGRTLTNAQRLSRGLPPKRPTRMFSPLNSPFKASRDVQ